MLEKELELLATQISLFNEQLMKTFEAAGDFQQLALTAKIRQEIEIALQVLYQKIDQEIECRFKTLILKKELEKILYTQDQFGLHNKIREYLSRLP